MEKEINEGLKRAKKLMDTSEDGTEMFGYWMGKYCQLIELKNFVKEKKPNKVMKVLASPKDMEKAKESREGKKCLIVLEASYEGINCYHITGTVDEIGELCIKVGYFLGIRSIK